MENKEQHYRNYEKLLHFNRYQIKSPLAYVRHINCLIKDIVVEEIVGNTMKINIIFGDFNVPLGLVLNYLVLLQDMINKNLGTDLIIDLTEECETKLKYFITKS